MWKKNRTVYQRWNCEECLVFFDKVLYSDEIDYEKRPTGREMWNSASMTKPMRFSD